MTLHFASKDRAPFKTLALSLVALLIGITGLISIPASRVSAACQAPAGDYGSGSASVTISSSATFRVWSRIMAPDTQSSSYLHEIDGNSGYSVGGGSVAPGSWTWVDYKDANTGAKIDTALTSGTHTLKFIGRQSNVKLDKVIFASDLRCTPVDDGSNCDTPSDTTSPVVSLTAPAEGSVVSDKKDITANATDNTSIAKVDFYANSTLIGSDTTAPYGVNWDSTKSANGSVTLIARAFDSANNISTDSYNVIVQNGDTQAPTVPTGLVVAVNSSNKATLTWKASTDNVGIKGYTILRNGTPLIDTGSVLTYQDVSLVASQQYTYQIIAFDAAGNKSATSAAVAVTTPNMPDTQVPTSPSELTATAVSASQINLAWKASTDNSGAVTYDVYTKPQNSNGTKIGSSTTTGFGATGLKANTDYTFYIIARDAAGNSSAQSNPTTTKTLAKKQRTIVWGTVRDTSGRAIRNARVVVETNGKNRVYQANSQGYYVIRDLSTGNYTLTYKANGYTSKTLRVSLGDDAPKMQNVSLVRR